MNFTDAKLNEAKFFLGELERVYYEYIDILGADDPKPPTSQYYLSAFISSARSVMWVMRHEYNDVPGWESWYDSQKANREHGEDELLKKINDIRIRSEKKSPLALGPNIAFKSISDDLGLDTDETLPPDQRKRFNIKISKVPEEGDVSDQVAEPMESLVEVRSFFLALQEFPKEDILKLCKSYLSFLDIMVSACKERFG